ncbi:BnaAnng19480D [Brassica napus]|uniref:BnaAnng19480D protein n=1 Tax=Brassica napus TaxID=3708 RepID=A0A078JDD0_BRANA|nr:BnaAnng19480D [Brassica napus]
MVKLNKYWYELRWTFLRQERARRVQHHQTRPVCHRRTRSHDAVS